MHKIVSLSVDLPMWRPLATGGFILDPKSIDAQWEVARLAAEKEIPRQQLWDAAWVSQTDRPGARFAHVWCGPL